MKKTVVAMSGLLAAGSSVGQTFSFDTDTPGTLPAPWEQGVTGRGTPRWAVRQDPSAPSAPNVLQQSGTGTFPWCVLRDSSFLCVADRAILSCWGLRGGKAGAPFKVTVDQDKRIGASFIDASAVKDLVVTNDIVYAKPGVKPLKYDVFAPKGARNLPIIVIIHGGGWTANDEDIMRGLARELTKGGKFVVASVDYRWAGKGDGDAAGNTMADLINDVFGGIAHIMEHASQYGGDPTRIGVTGDSAGGHLSAAASCPIAESVATRILCLPLHPGLTRPDVERIATLVC